jgi:hypothetical protein
MWSLAMISFLSVAMVLGSFAFFSTAVATQSFSNVQVFITPQNSTDDSFQVSAYNTTGGLVASTSTEYPAASFELPSGTYVLTVMASQPNRYPGPEPLAESSMVIPYPTGLYPAEYGYSLVDVASSTSVAINTTPISELNTTTIMVRVSYVNGSVAANATVGASILGGYYWIYGKGVVLSNQTSANGVATLSIPSVPVEVTAWKWLPIFLPKNETTTQVNVGGELANVTAYWEPTYVGLAGGALVIPPQTSADITLYTQEQSYWVMPYGVATPSSGTSSPQASSSVAIASDPSGVPTNQYTAATSATATTVTALPTTTVSTTIITHASSINTALEVGIVISLLAVGLSAFVAIRKK